MCANDCIDRAGVPTVCAPNTQFFFNDRDRLLHWRCICFEQWQRLAAKQSRKLVYRFLTAWRAKIDRGIVVEDRRGIRFTAGISTLRALRLWQQIIDRFYQRITVGRQLPVGIAEQQTRDKRDSGNDAHSYQDCTQHRFQISPAFTDVPSLKSP